MARAYVAGTVLHSQAIPGNVTSAQLCQLSSSLSCLLRARGTALRGDDLALPSASPVPTRLSPDPE